MERNVSSSTSRRLIASRFWCAASFGFLGKDQRRDGRPAAAQEAHCGRRPRRRGDHPSRRSRVAHTTDFLVIARDLLKAGAGLRSIAEPVVDTTSDFAELVLAMPGVAAKLECRRIKERTARGRADAKSMCVKFGR